MKDISAVIEKVYCAILIALTAAMFVTVTYNVFMRFVMNRSVGWADELSRFIFIWMSYLGTVLAFRNDEHVGIGFLVDRVKKPALRRIIAVVQQLLILVVLVFLTWFGYQASRTVMNVSPALSIPMSLIYFIVPICGFLMVILGLWKLFGKITGRLPDTFVNTSVE
ncbi:MAG: TRAP transporter small permease [Spirochaetaceae bacterium]|nr:TRAP transporter small permease [Spirochaetaceae bacterium]MDT8296665.1 TRAP transporter small permease [Spirochaetaceae bacterium]